MVRKARKGLNVANIITSVRQFMGMVKGLIPEKVPMDKYVDAENIQLTQNTEGTMGAATPALGNLHVFDKKVIAFGADSEDYKGYRIAFNLSGPGYAHAFTIKNSSGAIILTFTITSAFTDPLAIYNDLTIQLEAESATFSVYINPLMLNPVLTYVGFKIQGLDYTVEEVISGDPVDVHVIKEFLGIASNGVLQPLKSFLIGSNLYVISSNGNIISLSVDVKDDLTETWTSTTVLMTKQIKYASNAIIDLDGQIDQGTRVSLYFTGKGYIPRTFYVTDSVVWEDNYALTYNENPIYLQDGNPNGFYTYNNVEINTRKQVVINYGTISLSSVNDGQGSLPTGSYTYLLQQRLAPNVYTSFSQSSGMVDIYSDALTDTQLSGNPGGDQSSKSITLTLNNLLPANYDKVRLVYVYNSDGAITAGVVGEYDITSTSITVTHTGNEQAGSITFAELAQIQRIVKSAANLVINRNRLLDSDIEYELDPNLSSWCKTIGVTTQRTTIAAIGTTYSNVAEYQLPGVCFTFPGYMVNETYRLGIQLKFTIGSTVTYFVKDHKITFATGALTTGSGDEPAQVYVYYPQFTVDFSTAPLVNGVPLINAIDGFSFVRQQCIPEILATGYGMINTGFGPDTYGVGTMVVNGAAVPSFPYRKLSGFFSPDILFDKVGIQAISGDQILNYGQPVRYNNIQDFRIDGIHADYCNLKEFNGAFGGFQTVNVVNAELVDFNSKGVKILDPANPAVYSTEIDPVNTNDEIGFFNQKSLGVSMATNLNPVTANTDYYFYYNQYYRPLPNKYGLETSGSYISCNHFKKIDRSVSVYIEDVFGGDTFTQKNFFKFCNIKNQDTNDYFRQGISFYSQNRGNYQLRYFDNNNTFLDYPYTTTSLVNWLSGLTTGAAQDYAGTITYSDSYTPTNQFQTYASYNPNLLTVTKLTDTIQYSQLKIEGAVGDAFRVSLPADVKTFQMVYGAITNMFRSGNNLIVHMENAVCIQQVDQQAVISDPNSPALIIGDGTVLGAQEGIISNHGSPIKTGAVQYVSPNGGKWVSWYSPYKKKWLRYAGDGVRDLGLEDLVQPFLTEFGRYLGAEWSVVMGYDSYTNELLLCAHADIRGAVSFDLDTAYNKNTIIYVQSLFTQKVYYKARKDVPAGKDPSVLYNQMQFWEKHRQSNYVLSFNEELNVFSGFYSYLPVMIMPYKNTFLTFSAAPGLEPNVYEHNRRTNTFYGEPIVAQVTMIFADQPDIYKRALTAVMATIEQPVYYIVRCNSGLITYGEPAYIPKMRDLWWSDIRNDATIRAENPNGLNDQLTEQTRGEIISLTVFFKNSDQLNPFKRAILAMTLYPKMIKYLYK